MSPYDRARHRTGRNSVAMNATAGGVGKTEIAESIQEAQEALGWSDRGLASKAGVTVKMVRHLKRPLDRNRGTILAPGPFLGSARIQLNPHAQRALEKIVTAFEARA